ncbi:cytochrome c maturation protein CcmE, partial [Escherichia coli]|nr:cytochrome c maturation protein CcmE [Escherichia coli]
GQLGDDGQFTAEEVLAKHDENYMPPELAKSLTTPDGKHSCAPFKSVDSMQSASAEPLPLAR